MLPRILIAAGLAGFAAAQTPDANDLVWQKSVQKFDDKRVAILKHVDQTDTGGRYKPSWESLTSYEAPKWYQDAKFGIFIHWGAYAVPAFGSEWYPRNMYLKDSKDFKHQVATFGAQSKSGYKDFIPQFKAEKFDANTWADLFQKSGAKYIVPVAEHHDGFPMYDSDLTDWSAVKMGPKRDIVGELEKAVRARGLHFGASSHRAEHYFFMNGGREFDSDVRDPKYAAFYGPAHAGVTDKNGKKWDGHPDKAYLDDWLARTSEIVTKYRPEVLWFDWWIERKEFVPYLQRLASFYYNDGLKRGYQPAINYKFKAYPDGAAVLDIERGQLDSTRKLFWQTDTSVSEKSWGYIRNDTFRSPESLIGELVDIVSKNGTLLLNIGPRADGVIPEQAQQILLSMGKWLQTNGEAIYQTRPWKTFGEGPTKVSAGSFQDAKTAAYTSQDIRFTTRGKTLYAISMAWPSDGKVTVKSVSKNTMPVRSVQLLGSSQKVKWVQDGEGLKVQLSGTGSGRYAFVLKIS